MGGGVSSRRTLILLASVAVGLIAAYALYTYVGGIEDRAHENAERVEIYKIVSDIPKGMFGDEAISQGLIEKAEIPREFRPANAITDLAVIRGRVAVIDLPANQPVLDNQFVLQSETLATFANLLGDGEVAITISVDQVRGVAGLLVPGDFVNVFVNADAAVDGAGGAEGQPAAGAYTAPARLLYQKVQILAVGQTPVLAPGQTAPSSDPTTVADNSGLVTLAVPAEAAQRIASVDPAAIYLALVPKDYQPVPIPPIDASQPLPGEVADQLTPYGPAGKSDS
jgi:pilus assembly protein CpaB